MSSITNKEEEEEDMRRFLGQRKMTSVITLLIRA